MNIKRLALFLSPLLFFCAVSPVMAQWSRQRCDSDCAKLSLQTDTINYGKLIHNAVAFRKITYRNTGSCPLIISSVNGLGYHDLALSKKFLQPGDSGTLSIYNPTDKIGRFLKAVVFYSNASAATVLYLQGEVVHETVCADMKIPFDTLNLGPVHYVFGKHFALKIPSTGKCPLLFKASATRDEYLNLIDFSMAPVPPGDSATIDIHIGGQAAGHYYGLLTLASANSVTPGKTVFVKATLAPPDKPDAGQTTITANKDIINVGNTNKKVITVFYTITNTGTLPLRLYQPGTRDTLIQVPDDPIQPGQSGQVKAYFLLLDAKGPFIRHFNLLGNFVGRAMPLYIYGTKED